MLKPVFRSLLCLTAIAGLTPAANAATFPFNSDPFAGSNALATPGRQVVGNEISIPVFNFANDVLALNPSVFGFQNGLNFLRVRPRRSLQTAPTSSRC